ncbi:MAG: VWA domain-containing protein [Acidobacteria bacterium]|nr:VWA domain-containing protein [Acidobacteriota bacterium]
MKRGVTVAGAGSKRGGPLPARARKRPARWALLGVAWASLAAAAFTRPPAEAPVIVSRVELVPVDVLVTVRGDGPLPPLSADDFEVFENGEPRPLEYFAPGFPGDPAGGAAPPVPASPAPAAFGGPGRTFVVFIGRMGTVDPFDSLGDLAVFLRDRLGPDDRVALMAYNRMTPFTARIEDVLDVLGRYRRAFREIEAIMQVRTDDLLGIVERDFAPDVQQRIDGIFEAAGTMRNRLPEGVAFPTSSALKRLSRAEQARGGRALMDLQNLHRAVGILDRQPGAKHLLFFSADGLFLKHPASDHQLALAANAARVAVHTFQTGGMDSGYTRQGVDTATALGSIRRVSDLTGGLAFVHAPIAEGLRAVDRLTRSTFTLGFSPSGKARPGEYRSIRVRVKRPGLALHYRRYYRG